LSGVKNPLKVEESVLFIKKTLSLTGELTAPNRPIMTVTWYCHVEVYLYASVKRDLANLKDLSYATSQRYSH